MTSYTGGNNKAFRRILQVALMTSYTGAITSFQKNPSSGIDDELYRGNNKTFRRIIQVALMTSYIGRGNKNAVRRILQVALMTSYTGAITRLSE